MYFVYRKSVIFIIVLLECSSVFSQQWNLVWSDEFEGTGLPDASKWSFDVEGNNWDWGNNEAQNYTPADRNNAWLEQGNLVIEARKEQYTWPGDNQTKEYTSARLVTKGKGDWLYGKVEVRALLPTGRGMWPAIWMLPTDSEYGDWPSSGELDIMENVGYDPNMLHCNIHTEAYNHSIGTNKGNSVQISAPSINWHVYSVEWGEENVSFYCDGSLVFSFNNEHNTYREWPFDKPFHLLLNVAVGGGWGGTEGIDDNIFPQRMLVDYVRVYTLSETLVVEQQPFGGVAHSIPGIIEFEDFDIGGQDSSYFDTTPGNEDTVAYRAGEGVDVEVCSDDDGGYNVAYAESGEWMEYTVNVLQSGLYTISFRVACNDYGRTISLSTNGVLLAENVPIPYTGGWQAWENIIVDGVEMLEGEQVLRVTIGEVQHVNLNYMEFIPEYIVHPPSVEIMSPSDSSEFEVGSIINIEILATPYESEITWVDYYLNEELIGTTSTYPFSFSFTADSVGEFALEAYVWETHHAHGVDSVHISIVPVTPRVHLQAGWNLIGYPKVASENIEIALASIWEHVHVVKSMDSFYDKNQPTELNLLTELEYSLGYFIWVDESCNLVWP